MNSENNTTRTISMLNKLIKLSSKSVYLDYNHRTKVKRYFPDINIVCGEVEFLDPLKNYVSQEIIDNNFGEQSNTPIMFNSTLDKEGKPQNIKQDALRFNSSGIINLSYYKKYFLTRQIIIDIIVQIFNIFPSTENNEIIKKVTDFTKNISLNEKKISLRYKILKLLYNLEIMNKTDHLRCRFSNFDLIFEVVNKDQELILLFKELLEFYLSKVYSLNRNNPFYFPLFVIHFPENTSNSSQLLLGKLLKNPFNYPFKVLIYTSKEQNDYLKIPVSQYSIFKGLNLSKKVLVDKIIAKKIGNSVNNFKLQELINVAGTYPINAHALTSIFNTSKGFIEKENNYGKLLKNRLENLSINAKTILRFLVLFNGTLPKIFLSEIFQSTEQGKINFALRELQLAGLILFLENYQNISMCFYTDFRILDNSFNRNSYLTKNNLLINRIFKRFFSSSLSMQGLAFNTELSILAKKVLIANSVTFNYEILIQKNLVKELKIYFKKTNNHPDFLALAQSCKDSGIIIDPEEYLGILFELGNFRRVIRVCSRYLNSNNFSLTSQKRIIPLITSGLSKAILRPKNNNKYLKDALKGMSLALTHNNTENLFSAKLWLSRFYQKNREYEKSIRYLSEDLEIAKNEDDKFAVCRLYFLLALNYYYYGKYQEANDQADLALIKLNKLIGSFIETEESKQLSICFEDNNIINNNFNSEIIYLKALIKSISHDFDSASKDFKKVINGFELTGDYRNLFLCSMDYSSICEKRGDLIEAGSIIKKAFNLGRNYNEPEIKSELYKGLAFYYITKNKLGKAKNLLETNLRFTAEKNLDTHFIKNIEKRADIAFLENDYELSLRCLNFILKKYESSHREKAFPEVFFKIAKVYTDLKKSTTAFKILSYFKQKNFQSFITGNNLIAFNNLKIENYLNDKNFDFAKEIFNNQKVLLLEYLNKKYIKNEFGDFDIENLTENQKRVFIQNPDIYLFNFFYLQALIFFQEDNGEKCVEVLELIQSASLRTKLPELLKLCFKISDFYKNNNFIRDSLKTLNRIAPLIYKSKSENLNKLLLLKIRELNSGIE